MPSDWATRRASPFGNENSRVSGSYQGRLTEIGGGPIVVPTELRFRIYLGGDDTSLNSSGLRVYDETASVEPSDKGIFSHLIGSGGQKTLQAMQKYLGSANP